MKKTLFIATLAFSLLLVASPLAAAASNSSSSSSDFNYIPQEIYQFVGSASALAAGSPTFNPLTACHSGAIVCYTPAFIKSAYDFPSTPDGTGTTIVIVDAYGSPTIANDLASFDTAFHIPAPPSFTILCPTGCSTPSYTGNNPHGPFGWSIETSLDVEYAHAMAPGAAMVLVVAGSSSGNSINVAESRVIPLYPGAVMSQSFGIPEAVIHNNNAQVMQAEKNYAWATSLGWTIFASAGDSGATNGYATANALFPSSDPLVTSVGGTEGYPYPAGLAAGSCPTTGTSCTPSGYGDEQVWNEPAYTAAGGGSPSLLFSGRSTPDVSYNAAVNGGVLVYWSAAPQLYGYPAGTTLTFVVGGTSAGSPQWAAIAALADVAAGSSLGSINTAISNIGSNPTEYANDFHDITVGDNGLAGVLFGYHAGTGYDYASGWGTPDVTNLITDLA